MIRNSFNNDSGEEFSFISTSPLDISAPSLIFFHATGFNGQTYWQLIKELEGQHQDKINFISFDQRGHGHSTASANPEELKTWSAYLQDALDFADYLEGPIFCSGHSMGAIVAAKVASLRKDRVRKLIMLEPVLYSPYECFKYSLKRKWGLNRNVELVDLSAKRRRHFESQEEMIDSYYGRGIFSTWEKPWIQDYVEGGTKKIGGGKVELTCSPEWESSTFQTTDMNSWPYLRKLDIPVYIICGNINSTFTPKARKATKKLGKNWQIEVFPEASHSLPMELGQDLIDRIHQFMSK